MSAYDSEDDDRDVKVYIVRGEPPAAAALEALAAKWERIADDARVGRFKLTRGNMSGAILGCVRELRALIAARAEVCGKCAALGALAPCDGCYYGVTAQPGACHPPDTLKCDRCGYVD